MFTYKVCNWLIWNKYQDRSPSTGRCSSDCLIDDTFDFWRIKEEFVADPPVFHLLTYLQTFPRPAPSLPTNTEVGAAVVLALHGHWSLNLVLVWLLLLPGLVTVDITACDVLIDKWSWPRPPPFSVSPTENKFIFVELFQSRFTYFWY